MTIKEKEYMNSFCYLNSCEVLNKITKSDPTKLTIVTH
jgi:hypothetical protein